VNTAAGIHHHAKLMELPARAKKLVLGPALPLAYKLDGVVPRIRNLRNALVKGSFGSTVQSITERGKGGTEEGELKSRSPPEKAEGRPTAAPNPATVHEFTNSRRFTSSSEESRSEHFQDVGGAFDGRLPA